jgi:hypothetical protein
MSMTHAAGLVPSTGCYQNCFAAALLAMHGQQQQPVQHTGFVLDAQQMSSSKQDLNLEVNIAPTQLLLAACTSAMASWRRACPEPS